MPKKASKQRLAWSFLIEKAFPPTDPVAVDLLRLQAAYNDLSFVWEWASAHKKAPKDLLATKVADSRSFLQVRQLGAIIWEALKVVEEMEKCPGLQHLEKQMDKDGRCNLKRLRRVLSGRDPLSKKFLAITRHATTYHYDRDQFTRGLKRVLSSHGKDSQCDILSIQGSRVEDHFHFELPGQIRAEIIVGLTGADVNELLRNLLDLSKAFGTFLERLCAAYCKDRGLTINFRPAR